MHDTKNINSVTILLVGLIIASKLEFIMLMLKIIVFVKSAS